MKSRRNWPRAIASRLLVVVLLGTSGCMSFLHPVKPPPIELSTPCQEVPKASRDHVYVFFIHGLDPLDIANLSGVRDYVHKLGFNRTYYGQLYHKPYFQKEALKIYKEDPDARFVLIGFSFGANMVRDIALALKKEGVPVALLVYLGGNTLKNGERDQPDNAARIVNILANGAIWHGDRLDRAENLQVPKVWHFGSPSHEETLKILSRELAAVAASVPYHEPAIPPSTQGSDLGPTPRPVFIQPVSRTRGEWDFLKPVNHIKPYQPTEEPEGPPILPPLNRIARK